ncbi:MAG: nitrate reductase molybdenum cofactor assembly chaperone [Defluviicoccus sp.]|nr:nitrate reductase molybdenum cofactor assembly chaperone [Defluviicoccus sp.]
MKTYRALAALLQYPTAELAGAAGEIAAAAREDALLSRASLKGVERVAAQLAVGDLLTAQESYVGLFDRSRSLSLHLFEHIHGESRDRGQAMVNLAAHYETRGYSIDGNELPDYLPLFLEFLSLTDPREAADLLADVVHILAAIRIRLERRGSDYAGLFQALEELAARRPDDAAVASLLERDKSPEAEAAELDKEWEEAPAFAGAGDGECPAARDTLNRMAELSAGAGPDGREGA